MPSALMTVRNVLGLLTNVKIITTIRIAKIRPPIRSPTSRARPSQPPPAVAGGVDSVALPSFVILVSLLECGTDHGRQDALAPGDRGSTAAPRRVQSRDDATG